MPPVRAIRLLSLQAFHLREAGLGHVLGQPGGRPAVGRDVARSHDRADAQHRLWRILDRCARSDVPELLRLARTLDAWAGELLAYWIPTGRRGVDNGPTEATNALIKKV